jgi:hypothetical protein
MAKLVPAMSVAVVVLVALSRIDDIRQAAYAPVVQAGGGGITTRGENHATCYRNS